MEQLGYGLGNAVTSVIVVGAAEGEVRPAQPGDGGVGLAGGPVACARGRRAGAPGSRAVVRG